ncbi:MAG TPA: hypothetical protein VJ716_07080 [Gaiellaceae bacterium]|nr:hypothetical protein [Gaiellaceae bacterium]
MKRLINILGALLTTALLTAGVAAAASLSFSTGKLGAGSAIVSGCTSSSLTATRNANNSGNVTQVNVLNVPQACAGEVLSVTLEGTAGAALGSAVAIVGTCSGGCTAPVTGFGTVSAAAVTAVALSLTQ